MAKAQLATADTAEAPDSADAPLLDMNDAAIKKVIARAKKRGYITYDQLNEALPQGEMSSDQIEDVTAALSEMGINIVENDEAGEDGETEAQADEPDDAEADNAEADGAAPAVEAKKKETVDRTDDPVRMYLREMGAVELLSREGEIAIAKRIEAGRDTMILGLCESPITFNAIIDWSNQLNQGSMQLREILDLDAMLSKGPSAEQVAASEEDDSGEISEAAAGPSFKAEEDVKEEAPVDEEEDELTERRTPRPSDDEEEDNTLSLAQMEEQLKPQALERFASIAAIYKKFAKVQSSRLDAMSGGGELSAAEERKYHKLREELTAEVESVQFHQAKIEYLVDQLYAYNRRLTALGGQMLRLAERHRVNRKDFLDRYVGHEMDDRWLASVGKLDKKWTAFATNEAEPVDRIRVEISEIAQQTGMALGEFRRIVNTVQKAEREARIAKKEMVEANLRLVDFDRQEVHQPRSAVPGLDSGRQHRPDEGGRQVRVSSRLQVLDLRDLVDQAGDHAFDRRSGADDPYPGPHDRDDQQVGPHQPPVPPRAGPRAYARGDGRTPVDAARQGPQGDEDRQGAYQPRNADRRRGGQPPRRLHRGQERDYPGRCGDPGEPQGDRHAGARVVDPA